MWEDPRVRAGELGLQSFDLELLVGWDDQGLAHIRMVPWEFHVMSRDDQGG